MPTMMPVTESTPTWAAADLPGSKVEWGHQEVHGSLMLSNPEKPGV
jgi:hypothetical protein